MPASQWECECRMSMRSAETLSHAVGRPPVPERPLAACFTRLPLPSSPPETTARRHNFRTLYTSHMYQIVRNLWHPAVHLQMLGRRDTNLQRRQPIKLSIPAGLNSHGHRTSTLACEIYWDWHTASSHSLALLQPHTLPMTASDVHRNRGHLS